MISAVGGAVPRRGLFARLAGAGRVAIVSAPAGSGKTVLLRSWLAATGPADRPGWAGWVALDDEEYDAQRFWLAVADALRATRPGSALIRGVTAAPGLDGWALTERLLQDLAPLGEPLLLVVDDLHQLQAAEARAQLELLVLRSAPRMRFVFATRSDPQLGLHRLRLAGELTEIRADDLRFSRDEARDLLEAAGVALSAPALAALHERTEGWAAGLRLATLSMTGRSDAERFAAEFSGSERTIAEYLFAEVLHRQRAEVRRLLLRTSVLDRVNGPLADLLSGGTGGERILRELETAGAFVLATDAQRTWYRYHRLFTDLLRYELRRSDADDVAALHGAAARWFAGHGHPVDAIQHAQAAQDWDLAAGLLAEHWPGFHLNGQAALVHTLLRAFPAPVITGDPELAAVAAADQLTRGSLEVAEHYLDLAAGTGNGQSTVLPGVVRMLVGAERGELSAVAGEVERLRARSEAPDDPQRGRGRDLLGLALISLGITEQRTGRLADAELHLDLGIAQAHGIGRPYLAFSGLTHQAIGHAVWSMTRGADDSRQAVELARQHGWLDDPGVARASGVPAAVLAWQLRPDDAEPWLRQAMRTLQPEAEPATAVWIYFVRGLVELAHGRPDGAVAAFRAAAQQSAAMTAPHTLTLTNQAHIVHTLLWQGDIDQAGQLVNDLSAEYDDRCDFLLAAADLRLARNDPRAALDMLQRLLDGSVRIVSQISTIRTALLTAIAHDALGENDAAQAAMERALDLAAEADVVLLFLMHRAPALLRRQTRQPALIRRILGLLDVPAATPPTGTPPLLEPLSRSELRVLRYLPTHLSMTEIADELHISLNTVRTHMRRLYAKLGTHRRAETVDRARALGLLAPPPTGDG
ncbi:LuxR C-terminal-related transcriptional regulator [Dactylosporangium sp. CA-233914]|uniref:LuxR C-terminal-related transcriptional regulator n=1 Tax=Dactylosporangium sp. CA-233914 TaxID=3239934 RepID=UPI003D8D2D1B